MNQLPARYNQYPEDQRGPYFQLTCTMCAEHVWMIPVFRGSQHYHCPRCFAITQIKIDSHGEVDIRSQSTYESSDLLQHKVNMMKNNPFPVVQPPPNSLDDLINMLK